MIKKLFECVVQRTTFPNFDYLLQRLPKTLSQNLHQTLAKNSYTNGELKEKEKADFIWIVICHHKLSSAFESFVPFPNGPSKTFHLFAHNGTLPPFHPRVFLFVTPSKKFTTSITYK